MNRVVIHNSTKCRTKFTPVSNHPHNKRRNHDPKSGKSWPTTPYRYFHAWKYCTHWCGRNKACLRTRKRSVLDDRTPLRWFYQCVSWAIKKAEPFETYLILRNRQAPCVQISTNSPRPIRTWTFICLFSCTSNWRFSGLRIRAKAQISLPISMNGNAIPNVYTFI